jgi:glycosyltransferase involved in cell wall biosynthesis
VHKVVLISPTHDDYFKRVYGINDGIVIDLPVRVWEYEGKNIEKVKNRFIFTSVPARGLDTMLEIWPRIRQEISDASLVITSDYRLWGCGRGNELFLGKALGLDGVQYLGAVTRPRLVEEQLKAELNVYTCNYEELFCIAVAESQVAGVLTITSDMGALKTTNLGMIISGDPNVTKDEFVKWSVAVANKHYIGAGQSLQYKAKARFHPDRIMSEWDTKVFNG